MILHAKNTHLYFYYVQKLHESFCNSFLMELPDCIFVYLEFSETYFSSTCANDYNHYLIYDLNALHSVQYCSH